MTIPETQSAFIPLQHGELRADLIIPPSPTGLVLFAHGSGSSRSSSRNQFVSGEINRLHMATLLFDLLTEQEQYEERHTYHLRFDIPLLATRLAMATDWASEVPAMKGLPMGYFGASTGGAAALMVAAERPDQVRALVLRGARPDLAPGALDRVSTPTLLIVGGEDHLVIELNAEAYHRLQCEKRLETIPGATHLFEEPGALERVASLAAAWFASHLSVNPHPLHVENM